MWKIPLVMLLFFACGSASAQLVQAVVANTSAPSPVIIVQHKSTFCASATSCSLAFTSNNASGNLLIYATVGEGNALTIATDTNSNTVANALTFSGGTGGAERVDYVTASNSGANTVTAHTTGTAHIHIHIWEVSGLASNLPDATGTTHQSSSTSQTVSTTGATTVNNELVFGFFNDIQNCFTFTAGAGFSPSESTVDCTGADSVLTEVMTVTTTGVQTATATLSFADITDNLIVTFK